MDKKQVIKQMVENYYLQLRIVGRTNLSLEDYIKNIFEHSPTEYTNEDLQYALSLKRG